MADKTLIFEIIQKAYKENSLTTQECELILKDDSCNDELFSLANLTRVRFCNNEVHLKALVEISNYCKNSCLYCGLRKQNRQIKRYKLNEEEIIQKAKEALKLGYKTIVLQSGESEIYDTEEICKIISTIHKFGARITLSFGEKSFEEYQAYRQAGADRYLLRIETTDENLYKKLHPKMNQKNRFKALENLQNLGYETGSGIIVGLPYQDEKMVAKDILYLKNQKFDMVGVGPFLPSDNTPLVNYSVADFTLSLKVMALIRLLMPDINIPATTAMETISKNGRLKALQCGANVVMPAIAEYKYRKNYVLYKNKITKDRNLEEEYLDICNQINSIGFIISKENGDSIRYKNKNL